MINSSDLRDSAQFLRSVLTELADGRSRDGQGQYASEDQQDPAAFKKTYSDRWKNMAGIAALGIAGAAVLAPKMKRFGGEGILETIRKAGANNAKRAVAARDRAVMADRARAATQGPKGPEPQISNQAVAQARRTNVPDTPPAPAPAPKQRAPRAPKAPAKKAPAKKAAPAKKGSTKKKPDDKAPSIQAGAKAKMRSNDTTSLSQRIENIINRL